MKIIDAAKSIFDDLSQPDDISVSSVSTWIRSSVGDLNLKIGTNYCLTTVGEISPELGNNEFAILKALYHFYYYGKKARASLGASAVDTVIQADSDNGSIKFLNRNEVAKSYIKLQNDAIKELNDLVDDYVIGQYEPVQVVGEDDQTPYNWPNLDVRSR